MGLLKNPTYFKRKKGIGFVIQRTHAAMWKRLVLNYFKLEKEKQSIH